MTDPTGNSTEAGAASPRLVALRLLRAVLEKHRPLDEALADPSNGMSRLEERDRGFARRLVASCLRRLGEADAALKPHLGRWPEGAPLAALRLGATELLFLGTPPHAAVSAQVDLLPRESKARGLVNAVLRKVSAQAKPDAAQAPKLNTPAWAMQRWNKAYGAATAEAIATAHLSEAPLDISVKHPAEMAQWAEALQADILPNGSLRRMAGGQVENLPGFNDGAWWVQDAAAALPAKLFGDVSGLVIADLCAAPGGKSAQLAAAGARVFAIDRAEPRVQRMKQNLKRLGLKIEARTALAENWRPEAPLDGILLDAPCSATGTIRRHPDLLYLKREADIAKLAQVQRRLLERALEIVKPGGLVVYCVCSLEPEEGEAHRGWLKERADCALEPIAAEELGIGEEMIRKGTLRTLPCHWAERGGLDGFYAMRLRKL